MSEDLFDGSLPEADFDETELDESELEDLGGDSASGGQMYEHFRFVADKGQQLLRVD